jgi:F-type H+-transporting ATPase subunit alpha
VTKFEQQLLRLLRDQHKDILGDIATKKEITADTEKRLVGVIDNFAKNFVA